MKIIATASPNIAFIKYWGKRESTQDETRNIGVNPSLSLTLSQAKTTVELSPLSQNSTAHEFWVHEKAASDADYKKIGQHIERVALTLGLKTWPHLKIHSKNNFPQGTGIASSASAFAALSTALLSFFLDEDSTEALQKLQSGTLFSQLARRGSGSAARSVFGGLTYLESTHATPLNLNYPLRDTIIIFSENPKKISSTLGHEAALKSPFFKDRLQNLPQRIQALKAALEQKNIGDLGPILETEALELHKIAESGEPQAIYAEESTQKFIGALAKNRQRDFYFTMDAGPNVHLISERPILKDIQELLSSLNLKAKIWEDWTGPGPMLERVKE